MEVAFRKNNKSFIAKVICWWTKSPYSHCELIFSNGLTFSAFIEDFETSFKSKEHLPDEWDYVTIPISIEDEYKIYQFCLNETHCKYDIIGLLLTQILPLSFENPYWWFCSEVCVAGLQQANILVDQIPHEVDPGELNELLKGMYKNE